MKEFIGEITFESAVEMLKSLHPDVAAELLRLIRAGIICIALKRASDKGYIDRLLNAIERKNNKQEPAVV